MSEIDRAFRVGIDIKTEKFLKLLDFCNRFGGKPLIFFSYFINTQR